MTFHIPDPHSLANCGPLAIPLGAGEQCPTCGTRVGRLPEAPALHDRRQRAREAFDDEVVAGPRHPMVAITAAREAAIETATRVKLTDDVVDRYGGDRFDPTGAARRKVMREVLVACGFEVEE